MVPHEFSWTVKNSAQYSLRIAYHSSDSLGYRSRISAKSGAAVSTSAENKGTASDSLRTNSIRTRWRSRLQRATQPTASVQRSLIPALRKWLVITFAASRIRGRRRCCAQRRKLAQHFADRLCRRLAGAARFTGKRRERKSPRGGTLPRTPPRRHEAARMDQRAIRRRFPRAPIDPADTMPPHEFVRQVDLSTVAHLRRCHDHRRATHAAPDSIVAERAVRTQVSGGYTVSRSKSSQTSAGWLSTCVRSYTTTAAASSPAAIPNDCGSRSVSASARWQPRSGTRGSTSPWPSGRTAIFPQQS